MRAQFAGKKGGCARTARLLAAATEMPVALVRDLDVKITWLNAVSWLSSLIKRFGWGLMCYTYILHTQEDPYEREGKRTATSLSWRIELKGFKVLNRYVTDACRLFGGRRARIEALARSQAPMGTKTTESCWRRRYRIPSG